MLVFNMVKVKMCIVNDKTGNKQWFCDISDNEHQSVMLQVHSVYNNIDSFRKKNQGNIQSLKGDNKV